MVERRDLLIEAGLALASELSLPAVLQRIVELAVQVTEARYGAVGVLGPGNRIVEFVTTGVTAEHRELIGHIPVGRGILGALIEDARPLRLHDIKDDPRSVGFPPNHPPMQPFLGAPVTARGRMFGNIYLTREPGERDFTAEDEEFRERFKRESRLAASIEHPNVIPIHEAGEADGVLFLTMRYVDGTDLRSLLDREGTLEPRRAARIVAQVPTMSLFGPTRTEFQA